MVDLPTVIEREPITPNSFKTMPRAEIARKAMPIGHRRLLTSEQTRFGTSNAIAALFGYSDVESMGEASAIPEAEVPENAKGSQVSSKDSVDAFQKRLQAKTVARNFVHEIVAGYDEDRGPHVLPGAINKLLQLTKEQQFVVIDAVFEQLIYRVTKIPMTNFSEQGFPREGSFWVACLTLTKGAREHLDLRKAFINLLRDYADSTLGPTVSKRLLRNVD